MKSACILQGRVKAYGKIFINDGTFEEIFNQKKVVLGKYLTVMCGN